MKLFSLIVLAAFAATGYSQSGNKTTIYLRGKIENCGAQYRNNDKILFISIAVKDNANRNARYRFLHEIQPDWLQLEDQNNSVYDAYVVNGIPRYILIDKHGNIVDFDAPRPGKYQQLITLLNREIAKD